MKSGERCLIFERIATTSTAVGQHSHARSRFETILHDATLVQITTPIGHWMGFVQRVPRGRWRVVEGSMLGKQ